MFAAFMPTSPPPWILYQSRHGLRLIHSFAKQNSKNDFIVLMFFAAVCGLSAM